MAVKVANEILSESDNIDLRMLCKTLSLLEISPGNEMVVKDLSILCNRILEVSCSNQNFFISYYQVMVYTYIHFDKLTGDINFTGECCPIGSPIIIIIHLFTVDRINQILKANLSLQTVLA